jgi:WYL domain
MENITTGKRWGAEQRLEFIEFFSFWEGAINRSHLIEKFGVSAPQASADLTNYQQLAPNNLRYDLRSKRYVTTAEFECKLIRPDADRYLKQLTMLATHSVEKSETWLGTLPAFDVIPIPNRRVDPTLLQAMLRSIRGNQSIEVEYHSMSKNDEGASLWRRITPHSFASDGFRWHVRAYCHRSERFKDFLLSRCWGTRAEGAPGQAADQDKQWSTYFNVELVANPLLTDSQKCAIELDYAMINGVSTLAVRYALLYYFDKRLRSDIAVKQAYGAKGDPREVPVIVANWDEYVAALQSLGGRKASDQSN